MKYSILIQGEGEAQTGTPNAADIRASKIIADLQGGKHQITHASIILDDTKRLPLVGGVVKHEVPGGIQSASAEELPAEIKKLDKKELQAAVLALRSELDAAKALLEEASAKPVKDGGNEIPPSDTTNPPTE